MATDPIPDDVRRFILMSIDSVAQMEALLLLREKSQQAWDIATVSKRLYSSEQEASEVLARLCEMGLLHCHNGEPPLYQYRPHSPDLDQLISRVAESYAKYLVPITNLIHSKPKTRIQEFADAFKLRKEE